MFTRPFFRFYVWNGTTKLKSRRREGGGGSRGSNKPPLGRQIWQKVTPNVRLLMMGTGQKELEQQKNMDG